jgi:hypothetical protein
MKELQDKEQILMAYYTQYYTAATTEDVAALDEQLSQGIGKERYEEAMNELKEEGLINGLDLVKEEEGEGPPLPMATNEGMLYINNTLNLQSDAVEDHQLDYLDNNLKTSGLELTLEPVKTYIEEMIRQQK